MNKALARFLYRRVELRVDSYQRQPFSYLLKHPLLATEVKSIIIRGSVSSMPWYTTTQQERMDEASTCALLRKLVPDLSSLTTFVWHTSGNLDDALWSALYHRYELYLL